MKLCRRHLSLLTWFLLVAIAASCKPCSPVPTAAKVVVNPQRVGIMTFNVENLFDTEHQDGKLDYTFLPLWRKQRSDVQNHCKTISRPFWQRECLHLDWNEKALEAKLQNLAHAILQVQQGRGPDVLVLQEVENISLLKRLANIMGDSAGYTEVILIEGNDARGIDIGMLSRLPLLGAPVLHTIAFSNVDAQVPQDTRGILQAEFRLPNGEPLVVYGVHFPAPFHDRQMRLEAFARLNELRRTWPEQALVIATGDFNVTYEENADNQVFITAAEQLWQVPHLRRDFAFAGTHYYHAKKSWSFLDAFLYSQALADDRAWSVDQSSMIVANQAPQQTTRQDTPKRFNAKRGVGTSDHFPLYLELGYHP